MGFLKSVLAIIYVVWISTTRVPSKGPYKYFKWTITFGIIYPMGVLVLRKEDMLEPSGLLYQDKEGGKISYACTKN
jgi:hypothetical protein